MKKNLVMFSVIAGCVLMSSCVSKKSLENCQAENQKLSENFRDMAKNYQDAKEQLAASTARMTSLEDQLAQQKKTMPRCRARSTRVLPTPGRTTSASISWLTRSTSRTSISAIS